MDAMQNELGKLLRKQEGDSRKEKAVLEQRLELLQMQLDEA